MAQKSSSSAKGCWLAILIPTVATLLIGIGVAVINRPSSRLDPRKVETLEERNARIQADAKAKFKALSPASHLDEAKKQLVAKPYSPAQLETAKGHLLEIPKDSLEGKEAQVLLARIDTETKKAEKAAAAAQANLEAELRKVYAKKLETEFLDRNLNVDVTTRGKDATILRIKWILTSKVAAHNLGKNESFWANVRELKFKRVEMWDGYDETWFWDL